MKPKVTMKLKVKYLFHGNSIATLQQYKWEDFDLARAGTYTYRFGTIRFDGTVNFSPQVSVYVHKEEKANLQVRPNPAKEKAVKWTCLRFTIG